MLERSFKETALHEGRIAHTCITKIVQYSYLAISLKAATQFIGRGEKGQSRRKGESRDKNQEERQQIHSSRFGFILKENVSAQTNSKV